MLGKVDEVPGLFYVATQFVHLNYIPLGPMKSFLILAGTEKGEDFSGVKIKMSWKSVFFGYLRAALVWGIILIAIGGLAAFTKNGNQAMDVELLGIWAGVIAAMGALYWISYRLTRAGPERALVLASEAGIAPEVVAQHFARTLKPEALEKLTAKLADGAFASSMEPNL